MNSIRVIAVIVLVLVVAVGSLLVTNVQEEVVSSVAEFHDGNNEMAEGAPQQTVVGTWSTREAVLGLTKVVVSSSMFLGVAIAVSALFIVLAIGALATTISDSAASRAEFTPVAVDTAPDDPAGSRA